MTCLTVKEATEKVLAECYEDSKNYPSMASNFKTLETYLGGRKVAKITSNDVYQLRQSLKAEGLADATINRKMSALSVVLKKAIIWGLRDSMPIIEYSAERNGRVRWLSDEEERRVLSFFTGDFEMASLVVFLLDTGARLSEALNARPEDIEDGQVYLEGKTGGRYVPLTDRAKALSLPFAITKRQAIYQWNRCRKALGYSDDPHFVLHILRHTFASRLVQRGVDLYHVQKLLGHSSIKTTERYAHLAASNLKHAINVLNIPSEVSHETTDI
jgi:integrase